MKMICMLLLGVVFSATVLAQNFNQNQPGPFSNARHSYCSSCKKRHAGNCTPNPPPTNTPAPLDGGLSILLVAGAAYGARKLRTKDSAQ